MNNKMLTITFRFMDAYTYGEWRTQTCHCSSVEKCKEFYGLGTECLDYEILSVKEE